MTQGDWDMKSPLPCSVVTRSPGSDVSAWGIPAAEATPFKAGDFVAAVRAGGSINCDVWTVTVHSAGTHTETIRHIQDEGPHIDELHFPPMQSCLVLRVEPVAFKGSRESYLGSWGVEDRVITRASLSRAEASLAPEIRRAPATALLIATGTIGENDDARFDERPAPYLTAEAMTWIRNHRRVKHLLVDLPSVDKLWDGGHLCSHKLYWGTDFTPVRWPARTITEFVRVNSIITSGLYGLQMSVAAWHSDAAPSRITLYRTKQPRARTKT